MRLFFLFLLWLGLTPLVLAQEGAVIRETRFEGLRALDEQELMRQVESRPGKRLDSVRLRMDVKRLAEKVYRVSARRKALDDGVVLTFVIEEYPVLREVRFIGNSQVKTQTLQRRLRVEVGEPLTREALRQTRESILREYQVAGYMRATLRMDVLTPPEYPEGRPAGPEMPVGALLQVQVEEGKKIRITEVETEGNKHFSDLRIWAETDTHESRFFFDRYFDEDVFEQDLQRIRDLYVAAGFLDVQVRRGAFQYDAEAGSLEITMVVQEGPRFRFTEVVPQGNAAFSDEEILTCFADATGRYFSGKRYNQGMENLRDLYGNAGYIALEVRDDLDVDAEAATVRLLLMLTERSKIYVGDVILERPGRLPGEKSWFGKVYGRVAPPVTDEAIGREVLLKSDTLYTLRDEARTEARLRRLGIFQTVEVESRATEDPAVRDAYIRVEESNTGEILLGLGYSESYGLYAWSGYQERNLGGQADRLNVNLLVGDRPSQASITHFNRHVGDSDSSLETALAYGVYRRPAFREESLEGHSELRLPLSDTVDLLFRARGGYVKTDLDDKDETAEDLEQRYGVGAARLKLVWEQMDYDRILGSRYERTNGFVAYISEEVGAAGGFLMEHQMGLEVYRRLGRRFLLHSHLAGGVQPFETEKVGPTERLYMGGGEDLRGFELWRAGPHDSREEDIPIGGSTKVLWKTELRYRLIEPLTVLGFLDFGMLDREPFRYGSTRGSVGLGLRARVKNVEMGVDFAHPFLHQEIDNRRFFHFHVRTGWGF